MQKYFPVMQYINVPNLITTLGMVFGIGACYFITLTDLKSAMICMFFASCMDLLDGFAAGKLNQKTRFGQYVDSLVDFFICCILPVIISLAFLEASVLALAGLVFYCACGLWRLAHFDVLLAEERDYFTGFPVPSGMGFTMLGIWLAVKFAVPVWVSIVLFFVSGLLMISFIELKKYGLWQKALALGGVGFIIAVAIVQ